MKLTGNLRHALIGITIATLTVAAGVAPATHAQDATPPTPAQVGRVAPAWVAQAAPYVRVSNYVATIDPAISKHLSQSVVAAVYQTVGRYNGQPLQARQFGYATTNATATFANAGACPWYAAINFYWWGFQVYFNHCVANDIVSGATGALAIARAIVTVCPPCALFAMVIGGVLTAYSAWVAWADAHCGNMGAVFRATWPIFFPSFYWIATLC